MRITTSFLFRPGLIAAFLLGAWACKSDAPCRPGTVFVSIPCPTGDVSVQFFQITVNGKALDQLNATCPVTTVELSLPSYSPEAPFVVTVRPLDENGKPLGPALSSQKTLDPSCTAIAIGDFAEDNVDGGTRKIDAPIDAPLTNDSGDTHTDGTVVCGSEGAKKNLGDVCSCNEECGSNHCVDGVCCNENCQGLCRSCALPKSKGMCTMVADGDMPAKAGECSKQDPSSCGTDGTCDGQGACRSYPDNTVCNPGHCAGSSIDGVELCVKGKCSPAQSVVCSPAICNPATSKCFDTCADSSQCVAGNACKDGSCGQKMNGGTCQKTADCISGNCVDGYCCDQLCTGACQACNVDGKLGACTNVAVGKPDPHGVCKDSGQTLCGQTGLCDGGGGCAKYAAGAVCSPATCSGPANAIPASTCDGKGACIAGAPVMCTPTICRDNACISSCTANSDCAAPNVCSNGSCGKKGLGQVCARGNECNSGNCVDGVCCNSTCVGACRACNLPVALGQCTNVGPASADPHLMCKDAGLTSCGTNGFCDGSGSCQLYKQGSQCGAQSCDSNANQAQDASLCDGAGKCVAGAKHGCTPNLCNGTQCGSSCVNDSQCSSPNTCVNNSCGKKTNGLACTKPDGSECVSGICAQGVCCNAACTGGCQSCALNSAKGACTNVGLGVADPKGTCTVSTMCGNTGSCDGNGGCAKADKNASCGSESCANGVHTAPRNCDGAGNCPAAQTNSCMAYTCASAQQCGTGCLSGSDCASGYYCNTTNGMCQIPKPNGNSCTGIAGECANTCDTTEGICCSSACATSTCMSCKGANTGGADGQCLAVNVGVSPVIKSQCAANGTCGSDGTCGTGGTCRQVAAGTNCGAAACSSNTFASARTCDGAGTCQNATMTSCGSQVCTSSGCMACSASNPCGSGLMCCSGTCRSGSECPGFATLAQGYGYDVSGNGLVVTGNATSGGPFRWVLGIGLSSFPTGKYPGAPARLDRTGATVVGSSGYWRANIGYTAVSNAGFNAVSGDGSAFGGTVFSSGETHPTRYVLSFGSLESSLGIDGAIEAISGDGSIMVGDDTYGGSGSISWNLFSSSAQSFIDGVHNAKAVNMDGTVVAGVNSSGAGFFRWTQATGVVNLPAPPSGYSIDNLVDISADGTIILCLLLQTSTSNEIAFLYDGTNGYRSVGSILSAAGVSLNNFVFSAGGLSDDGKVVAGTAKDAGGTNWAYRAVLP